MIFLDTNIILRFTLNDHPTYSPKAAEIFSKIESGTIKVCTSWLVIFEAVFVLQNSHGLAKSDISQKLLPILTMQNIALDQKHLLKETLGYYVDKNISFADAFHVALMNKKNINQIYSFDRDFDKFPHINRLEH